MRTRRRALFLSLVAMVLPAAAIAVTNTSSTAAGIDCSTVDTYQMAKQMNLRAATMLDECGRQRHGPSAAIGALAAGRRASSPNVNLITGAEVLPHVTQSESFVWGRGRTIVVNYNDSRGAPLDYSGASVSTDGGTTFTRLDPSPFGTGHGANYGDPVVAYDAKLHRWFAGDLVSGGDCGYQGIGLWTSTEPAVRWTTGASAHVGDGDDRESMWADNNLFSPHYGRLYISWNDFAAGGALVVTHSDDGIHWTPVTVDPTFIRDVQLTGSYGADGTVYLMAMDEGAGAFSPRQNVHYRSTDGGASWTSTLVGAAFAAPGDSLCDGYFAQIDPIWRYQGWGQPAAGPNGVVGYDYTVHGTGTDGGDIYFTRSTNNGVTWSSPQRLNTDTSGKAQWMPSLLFTRHGVALATWYDRRNTTDGQNYQRFGRISLDNGATWGPEKPISDVQIPQPTQPDPFVVSCYAGDYNYITANGDTGYDTWTDGRVPVSGTPQQDVFFARKDLSVGLCDGLGWFGYGANAHPFRNIFECLASFASTPPNRALPRASAEVNPPRQRRPRG